MFGEDKIMAIFNDNTYCIECVEKQLKIETLQKQIEFLMKELDLYKVTYSRPRVLKEVVHHPAKPRTSQCLYGIKAWDEYIYE